MDSVELKEEALNVMEEDIMTVESVKLNEALNVMKEGIKKFSNMLEGSPEESINGNLYMNLYTTIYNLCLEESDEPKDSKYLDELYHGYKTLITEYIDSVVLPVLWEKKDEFLREKKGDPLREKKGELMLRELVRRWNNYKDIVRVLSRFFGYLDRFYVLRHSLPTLGEVAIGTFFDMVYGGTKITAKSTATDAAIALIKKEREGEQIDRSLLKNVVGMFVEIAKGNNKMDYYEDDFQRPVVNASRYYYTEKAKSWIRENSSTEYLLKVEETLELEKDRAFHFLNVGRENELLEELQHVLLAHYKNQILEKDSALCALLRDSKKDDLSRMFRLFDKVNKGLDPIANIFREFVMQEGTALVEQAEDAMTKNEEKRDTSENPEQEFVRKIIEMHLKYEGIVLECFQNHKLFRESLDGVFQTTCNKKVAGRLTAELLSAFSDNVLKKGNTGKGNTGELSNKAIDHELENVANILSYIKDKDVFAENYRIKLASRLLPRSANVSNEQSMLTKLKQLYGNQFTAKMEGMVKDLSLSKDIQNKFVAHLKREDIHIGLDLNVTVLTTETWPAYKNHNINLPIELAKCMDVFKQFYSMLNSKRKLTWMYSLGTCTVEGRFNARTIELVLSTYQAALLMLFNESEKLSFDEIKSQLNLKDDDVRRVLHSLACARYKVLIKDPNTQKIAPTDYFEFNSMFADEIKSRRIKIPVPHSDERKVNEKMITTTRNAAIDAAIVRIMKTEKRLSFPQLQSQCIEELKHKFKPGCKQIKMRIEHLIQYEYLERDKDDFNVFNYLA